MDLHQGFRGPAAGPARALMSFLHEVDQLPDLVPIRRALRAAAAPLPGQRVLDAGCGIGLETRRLAEAYPDAAVTGLDVNGDLLELARDGAPANLEYVEGDLLDGLDDRYDVVRTERVLMYLPDAALDVLVDALAPGGRIALFELDYGATLLAPGRGTDTVLERVEAAMRAALPQPFMGRRLPRLLLERGLADVTARPFVFRVSEPVWRGIVHGTLRDLDRELNEWLDEQADAAVRGEFVAAFTGMLCTARRGRFRAASAAP